MDFWSFLAGMGCGAGVVAVLAWRHYASSWATLWQWSWHMRSQAHVPSPSALTSPQHVFAPPFPPVNTLGADGIPAPLGRRPPDEEAAPIELSASMMELVMQESEDWRRDEIAEEARGMLREGFPEAAVVTRMREMLRQ